MEDKIGCLSLIISIILILLLTFCANSCTASDWNDGICPDCDIRYELKAAYKQLKYYACPHCGKEVRRY
jgi:hypothetical protein